MPSGYFPPNLPLQHRRFLYNGVELFIIFEIIIFFFFKIPNSLDTEFELHQSSMLFVQTMETQGQASFYVEQPVAWLTREVKLNAVVTLYFAGPRAARYSEHPFPSLLLSWFRAPSR